MMAYFLDFRVLAKINALPSLVIIIMFCYKNMFLIGTFLVVLIADN